MPGQGRAAVLDSEKMREKMRAAVGPRADRYLKSFERIERSGGWAPGWNAAAFVHSSAWLWYRRMYGWSLLNLFAPLLLGALFVFGLRRILPESVLEVAWTVLAVGYFAFTFVAVPVLADTFYFRRLKRRDFAVKPPTGWTLAGALLVVMVLPSYMVYVTVDAQIEYQRRGRVAESLSLASQIRRDIDAFHANERRLPGQHEAARFRWEGKTKHVEAVGWDVSRQAIVATMGGEHKGARIELVPVVRGSEIEWKCRTQDMDPKYLPVYCR